MRDHVLSASGKYQEVLLVRNLPVSTDRFLFASTSYVANPPPPAKFVMHIPRSSIVGKWETVCLCVEAFYSFIGSKSVSSPSCKHLRYKQLSGFELRHDASEGLVNVEILGHFNDCSNCLILLLLAYIYSLCKFGDVSPVKSR